MRTALTAAISGITGLAIGAGGWALIGPEKTAHDQSPTVGTPAAAHSTAAHYASAQSIADKLAGAGYTVSMLHKQSGTAISDMGGTAYDLTISDQKDKPAPGDGGINMFPNHEALTSWTALSKSFGGVAVTGDTWAVSLPTDGAARVASLNMAPRIAATLGGTVQK